MLADSIAHLSTRLDAHRYSAEPTPDAPVTLNAEAEAEAQAHPGRTRRAARILTTPDPYSISNEPATIHWNSRGTPINSEFPDPEDPTGPTGSVFPQPVGRWAR